MDFSYLHLLAELNPFSSIFGKVADDANIVFLYVLNHWRLSEAANSITTLQKHGAKHNIVVFAMDDRTCSHISQVACVWTGASYEDFSPYVGELDRFKHWRFAEFTFNKIVFIALAVISGFSAFYVDSDTVFLQDPYIALDGDYELWIQDGSRSCGNLDISSKPFEYNTGVMFWRACRLNRIILIQLLSDMDGLVWDGFSAQMHDDQTFLSHYIDANPDGLPWRVKVLSPFLFPNGHVYFQEKLCGTWSKRCCDVVLVHNNFILDDFGGSAKIRRLKDSGLWFQGSEPGTPLRCCPRPQEPFNRAEARHFLHPHADNFSAYDVWRPYVDLVSTLCQGKPYELQLLGVGRQNSSAESLHAVWQSKHLSGELEVVIGSKSWLFLPSTSVCLTLKDWLLSSDELPPLGSLAAMLTLPSSWHVSLGRQTLRAIHLEKTKHSSELHDLLEHPT